MKIASIVAVVIVASTFCAQLRADEATKAAKIAELMKVQGLYDMIEKTRADSIKRSEILRPQYEKQIRDGFPQAPPDLWAWFDRAFKRFIEANQAAWSTEDAISLYGKLYGAQVTEDELDQILSYYKSPIGQKDVQASRTISPQWIAQLSQNYQSTYQANLQVFVDGMKGFINQCKAAKAAGSKTCEMPTPKDAGT